jgi:hypothetical protein
MCRIAVLAAAGVLLTGCYTLQPVREVALPPGATVSLDINDVGRVALGGSMGPSIQQVEGRLLDNGAEDYLLGVTEVRLVGGGVQVWRGEPVRIRREHVTSAYERRFSRSRSLALGATLVGGIVAFIAGRTLVGLGEGDRPDVPIDTAEVRIGRR